MGGRRREAARWAIVGLAAHLLLAGLFLAANDANPQWFVHFGREGSVLPVAEEVLGEDLLIPHRDGHDGQAFWLLARDPVLTDADQAIRYLDRPAYRSQRMAYPLVASPWRLGGEQALVWGLLLTNLAAVTLGTYAAALLALELGAPMRASLAFALNPAVLAGMIMDGSDVLAIAGVVVTLLFLLRGQAGPALLAAVVATLAKEPSLFAFAGVALLAPGLSRRVRLALVAVPAGVAGLWALYVRWRLGWPPSQIQEFALPFTGYAEAYRLGWRPYRDWANAAVAVALVPVAVLVGTEWWRRRSLIVAAALPYALLVPFLSGQVLDLPANGVRAIGPAVTLTWISAYVPRRRSISALGTAGPSGAGA